MAGRRFGRVLKGSVASFFAPAEDPRATYADPFQRQQAARNQIRAATARVKAARDRLAAQRVAAEAALPALDGAARTALAAGREDLARLALRRRQVAVQAVDQLAHQIEALDAELARLALVEERVSAHLAAAVAREHLTAARRSTAQAQIKVGEALSGVMETTPGAPAVEVWERDAEELEARAAAIADLLARGVLGDGDWTAPEAFETDAEIERQLAALRRESERASRPS